MLTVNVEKHFIITVKVSISYMHVTFTLLTCTPHSWAKSVKVISAFCLVAVSKNSIPVAYCPWGGNSIPLSSLQQNRANNYIYNELTVST